MKTVIIEYALISPIALMNKIEKGFDCFCMWQDLNTDYFEFTVWGCLDLAMLEDVLAEYV